MTSTFLHCPKPPFALVSHTGVSTLHPGEHCEASNPLSLSLTLSSVGAPLSGPRLPSLPDGPLEQASASWARAMPAEPAWSARATTGAAAGSARAPTLARAGPLPAPGAPPPAAPHDSSRRKKVGCPTQNHPCSHVSRDGQGTSQGRSKQKEASS